MTTAGPLPCASPARRPGMPTRAPTLVPLYRHGSDHLTFYANDGEELRGAPLLDTPGHAANASLSLGETRNLCLRPKNLAKSPGVRAVATSAYIDRSPAG